MLKILFNTILGIILIFIWSRFVDLEATVSNLLKVNLYFLAVLLLATILFFIVPTALSITFVIIITIVFFTAFFLTYLIVYEAIFTRKLFNFLRPLLIEKH